MVFPCFGGSKAAPCARPCVCFGYTHKITARNAEIFTPAWMKRRFQRSKAAPCVCFRRQHGPPPRPGRPGRPVRLRTLPARPRPGRPGRPARRFTAKPRACCVRADRLGECTAQALKRARCDSDAISGQAAALCRQPDRPSPNGACRPVPSLAPLPENTSQAAGVLPA